MFKTYLEWITPEKRKELEVAGKIEAPNKTKVKYNGVISDYIQSRMNTLKLRSSQKLVNYYNTFITTIPKDNAKKIERSRLMLTPTSLYATPSGSMIHESILFWWAVTNNYPLTKKDYQWHNFFTNKYIMFETIFPDTEGEKIISTLIKNKVKIQNKIVTRKTTLMAFAESYDSVAFDNLLPPALKYLKEYKNFIIVPFKSYEQIEINEWLIEQDWDWAEKKKGS